MSQPLRRFSNIIYRYSVVTSTNDIARDLAEAGEAEGTTVVAEEQTAGRGRLGRTWTSPKGEGLYHSVILRPGIAAADAPLLNLVIAVALAEMIQERYQVPVDIKWPNDVLIRQRKVAGILTELKTVNDHVEYVIAGVGVNLNQTVFSPDLMGYATSLRLETGRMSDPNELRENLYFKLDHWYDSFLTHGAEGTLNRWRELSSYAQGKSVRVIIGDRTITGLTRGLTSQGELIIETADGDLETILVGDVQNLREREP
jgi:BirA family biotin operon repressor/biotin-[acetyl-CoA-carboxylase] ligase